MIIYGEIFKLLVSVCIKLEFNILSGFKEFKGIKFCWVNVFVFCLILLLFLVFKLFMY